MTLFFNLNKLEGIAGSDPKMFIQLLDQYYCKKLPKKGSKYVDLKGASFILNPAPILKEKQLDLQYLVQYIKLAGRRDYFMYKQYAITSLALSFYPDLLIDNIKHNPLLKVTKEEIFFKYENKELKNGISIRQN